MSDETSRQNDIYIGWALYTGPSRVTPLYENSRWIAGQWLGDNTDTSEAQIKADIDNRIDCLQKALLFAHESTVHLADESHRRYFVVPEFYFHCRQGPYPDISIGTLSPYAYICASLQNRLEEMSSILRPQKWLICVGSVLTCNEPNIEEFVSSDRVKQRLDALNRNIIDLELAARSNALSTKVHIKALSYFRATDTRLKSTSDIDALMTHYRANPLCIVRNRGAVFAVDPNDIQCLGYEKQNESTVDLTMGIFDKSGLLTPGGMITEWMAGYPSISIIDGDHHRADAPLAARMSIPQTSSDKSLELGIEICLDHRLKRLRRTVAMTRETGAAEDNLPLDAQLIPSGGMQILDDSVSAGNNGVVFNCDGCDPILTEYNADGTPVIEGSGTFKQKTCGVYASSAQTAVQLEKPYYSHSQLTFRYGHQEILGYDNAKGNRNINGATCSDSNPPANPRLDAYAPAKRVSFDDRNGSSLFAAGLGELHLYLTK